MGARLNACHRLRLPDSSSVVITGLKYHRQFATRTGFPRVIDLNSPEAVHFRNSYLTLNGFVQSIRKQKRVGFATIGDGSCLSSIQAHSTRVCTRVFSNFGGKPRLSNGTAVSVKGLWVESQGKEQLYELHAREVEVLGDNESTNNPIQKKYQSPEFLRTIPHLRTKIPFYALMLRLRSQLISHTTSFFAEQGFVQTHTPIITSSDCEGAGEVFTVRACESRGSGEAGNESNCQQLQSYFRSSKYLTVSSQLHLEALAQSVGRVWALSPTFRAEKSDTNRHLSEFYMLEAELAFTTDLNDVMDLVESLLRELTAKLSDSTLGKELILSRSSTKNESKEDKGNETYTRSLEHRWARLTGSSWPRIRYEDAIVFLQKASSARKVFFHKTPRFETGLQTEHERYIVEQIGTGGPVFVTDYPQPLKPFYMSLSSPPQPPQPPQQQQSHCENSISTVACFDLLVPSVCELAGGSLREHRFDKLRESMRQKGLLSSSSTTTEDGIGTLDWYLDLRRFGSVCHGGFGLGFDRLLAYLSGISNIRDVVTFPRYHGKCLC